MELISFDKTAIYPAKVMCRRLLVREAMFVNIDVIAYKHGPFVMEINIIVKSVACVNSAASSYL